MAENIVKTTSTDLRTADSDLTIEDNRRIVFGAMDGDAKMSIRVNYKPSNYYFYALKPSNGIPRHLFSSDEAHSIKQADYVIACMAGKLICGQIRCAEFLCLLKMK